MPQRSIFRMPWHSIFRMPWHSTQSRQREPFRDGTGSNPGELGRSVPRLDFRQRRPAPSRARSVAPEGADDDARRHDGRGGGALQHIIRLCRDQSTFSSVSSILPALTITPIIPNHIDHSALQESVPVSSTPRSEPSQTALCRERARFGRPSVSTGDQRHCAPRAALSLICAVSRIG